MTRDELIGISAKELEKLPADELEIVARHFETEDRAELARRLAEEAEEMWSGDHEAPVPQAEWPAAHLQMLLGMHRDVRREARLDDQRRIASDVIDGLEPARRALLCWRLHTTVQRRVVARVAAATVRAIEEGLVKLTSFKEAAEALIDFEIGEQIDEIEDHYYHGADQHRFTAAEASRVERDRDYPDRRELDPSTRATLGLVSDEEHSVSNVFAPRDLAAPVIAAQTNDHTPALEAGEYESWVTRYEWILQEEYGIDARRSKLLARRLAADTLRIFESRTDVPIHDAVAAAFAWLGDERLGKAVIEGLIRTAEDLLLGPAEPADCPPGARSFVVHQHNATRRHFDLRLELGGVLKCWTLPRVPELRPGERRLAIHVEDHPRAWLGFSGMVPEGYGSGTVDVWDTGCWYADDDVSDGYQQGRFSFRLAGERLKGHYTLLRFRGREEGDTWLLIREEGDQMRSRPTVRSSALPDTHEPHVASKRYALAPQAAMRHAIGGWPPKAMASAGRGRRPAAQKPTGGRNVWDAIAAETERRVIEKECELVAMMDRLTRIYSGGRLAGRRVRPGTIVVERVRSTPEFPSLVFPDLASIADGVDVGAAVAIVKINPVEVELAGWIDPGAKPSPESDRLTTAIEQLGAAWRAGQVSEDEFVATRDALWVEAERAGVAVEIAWRLRTKWGTAREPAVAASLPPVPVRANPYVRYKLELYLRQIPTDAFSSVVSRWVRPSHDQIEAGQGAWQRVLELLDDHHSTCSQCPFVFGSNLDCATCRTWVLSLKQPGAPWTAKRIGAALYNCDEPAVATAAVEALAQSTQAPLTAAFFRDFADNFEARLAIHLKRPDDMDPGYRDHCRKAVEWLLPQPDFPLPEYPPSKGAPRSVAGVDILMRATPVSAGWRN